MSDINMTISQSQAVFDTSKDLLVSAGAGSGKTTVLARRISNLVASGNDIDRFLVVTFTKAAASEMKDRIRRMLIEHSEKEPSDHLTRQINEIDKAHISTIDSFCYDIVKEYYYVLDLDPASRLMSNEQTEVLKSQVINEYFRKKYDEQDEDFFYIEDRFSSGGDSEKLKELICDLYDRSMNFPDGIDGFVEIADGYKDIHSITDLPFYDEVKRQIISKANENYSLVKTGLRISFDDDSKGQKYKLLFETLDDIYSKLIAELEGDECFISVFEKYSSLVSSLKYSTAKTSIDREELKNYYDGPRKFIKDDHIFNQSYLEYEQQLGDSIRSITKIVKCIKEYSLALDEKKKRMGCLTFSDIEHCAYDILKDKTYSEDIKNVYDYIFVDEYQDVNDLQDSIIQSISKDKDLFLVGDTKQSIYEFRGANPDIFIEKMDNKDGIFNIINLQENFRTDNAVIDGLNMLFNDIYHKDSGGIEYSKGQQLIYPDAKKDIPYGEKPKLIRLEREKTDRKMDADQIAFFISKLIGQDMYDEKIGGFRKIVASDITVLGYSVTKIAPLLSRALREYGIASSVNADANYFDQIEISLVVNILKLVNNPHDDISLLSVMRSMAYGFTEDDLVKIRSLSDTRQKYFYRYCESYVEKDRDDDLTIRLKKLYEDLDRFSLVARNSSISDCIEFIIKDRRLDEICLGMPNGQFRKENLSFLASVAQEFEKNDASDINSFCDFALNFKGVRSFEKRYTHQAASDGVNITTVHKSKGLEYNIVILCDASSGFKTDSDDIRLDPALGIVAKHVDVENSYKCDNFFTAYSSYISRNRLVNEKMRLLYVALTRAKHRLYIFSAEKNYDKKISTMSSWHNMIYDSILDHTNTWDVWDFDEAVENEILGETVSNDEVQMSFDQIVELIKENASVDTSFVERDVIDHKYPYLADTKIPTKMSVSSIERIQESPEFGKKIVKMNDIPDLRSDDTGFSAMQKGTLTHRFLENLDTKASKEYSSVDELIEAEKRRMIIKEIFSPEQLNVVNIDNIARFLSTAVGQSFINAKKVYRENEFVMNYPAKKVSEEFIDSDQDILVQGMIDCYFENEDGTYTLLDYKTDHLRNQEDRENRIKMYSKQIELYRFAIEQSTGKRVRDAYICFISEGFEYRVDLEED